MWISDGRQGVRVKQRGSHLPPIRIPQSEIHNSKGSNAAVTTSTLLRSSRQLLVGLCFFRSLSVANAGVSTWKTVKTGAGSYPATTVKSGRRLSQIGRAHV